MYANMKKVLITLYGIFCYLLFITVCIYLAGFLLEIGVPKSINSGTARSFSVPLVINILLIFSFGFFHSLMARSGFKRVWTLVVPNAAERSTYVLQSSLFLLLLMWQWQPMPYVIWSFQDWYAYLFYSVFIAGVIIAIWSIVSIDHFELLGLRQVWHNQAGTLMADVSFKTPLLYRIVRHPMQFGTLILFWSTPILTTGHAILASGMTIYVLIGLRFEECALQQQYGENYMKYKTEVPMLIPAFRIINKRCI